MALLVRSERQKRLVPRLGIGIGVEQFAQGGIVAAVTAFQHGLHRLGFAVFRSQVQQVFLVPEVFRGQVKCLAGVVHRLGIVVQTGIYGRELVVRHRVLGLHLDALLQVVDGRRVTVVGDLPHGLRKSRSVKAVGRGLGLRPERQRKENEDRYSGDKSRCSVLDSLHFLSHNSSILQR